MSRKKLEISIAAVIIAAFAMLFILRAPAPLPGLHWNGQMRIEVCDPAEPGERITLQDPDTMTMMKLRRILRKAKLEQVPKDMLSEAAWPYIFIFSTEKNVIGGDEYWLMYTGGFVIDSDGYLYTADISFDDILKLCEKNGAKRNHPEEDGLLIVNYTAASWNGHWNTACMLPADKYWKLIPEYESEVIDQAATSFTVKVTNPSDAPCPLLCEYSFEANVNGEWYKVPENKFAIIETEAEQTLGPCETAYFNYTAESLKEKYPDLPKGLYRIKAFHCIGEIVIE